MSAQKPNTHFKEIDQNSNIEHIVEFLLREHDYFGESFWKNEESGEKRLNFFITLVTAVITVFGVILSLEKPAISSESFFAIGLFALISLLLFGMLMLLRMIQRNFVTDQFKSAMDLVRSKFQHLDKNILGDYQPFGDKPVKRRKLFRGSLVEMVILLNSILISGLIILAFSFYGVNKVAILIGGGTGLVLGWQIQAWYVERRYKLRPSENESPDAS